MGADRAGGEDLALDRLGDPRPVRRGFGRQVGGGRREHRAQKGQGAFRAIGLAPARDQPVRRIPVLRHRLQKPGPALEIKTAQHGVRKTLEPNEGLVFLQQGQRGRNRRKGGRKTEQDLGRAQPQQLAHLFRRRTFQPTFQQGVDQPKAAQTRRGEVAGEGAVRTGEARKGRTGESLVKA